MQVWIIEPLPNGLVAVLIAKRHSDHRRKSAGMGWPLALDLILFVLLPVALGSLAANADPETGTRSRLGNLASGPTAATDPATPKEGEHAHVRRQAPAVQQADRGPAIAEC